MSARRWTATSDSRLAARAVETISPVSEYLDRVGARQTLLVYARYDLTFPSICRRISCVRSGNCRFPTKCGGSRAGHYQQREDAFKFLDGWVLTRFLRRALT